jgi:hypothetical protein
LPDDLAPGQQKRELLLVIPVIMLHMRNNVIVRLAKAALLI